MGTLSKYRIHEVAKDFGMPTKTIMDLYENKFGKAKNHMQILEDHQLNTIFDAITQKNQVASMEDALAVTSKPKTVPAPEAPKAQEAPAVKAEPTATPAAAPAPTAPATAPRPATQGQPQQNRPAPQGTRPPQQGNRAPIQGGRPMNQPQQGGQRPPQQGGYNNNRPAGQGGYNNNPRPAGQGGYNNNRPAGQGGYNNNPRPAGQGGYNNNRPAGQGGYNNNNRGPIQGGRPMGQPAPRPAAPAPAPQVPQEERKRERRVVDTSAATVNVSRFDDHADNLVSERMHNIAGGKQRIGNKNNKKRPQHFGNKRRNEEQDKMRKLQLEIIKKTPLTVHIPDEITVGELASRMKKTAAEVIKQLIKLGVMAAVNQVIDYETAYLVAEELGCKVEKEVIVTIEERLIDDREDKDEELEDRSPVVVVMGHVDHGKTSLLDAIRKTNVVEGEAGGITQHIGAYQVEINGQPITFLDTPGHAAFTSMRARGAKCTDIAILVVAADDGIMPQTVEAINHAKAAEIPIIVAINKMDKPGANPDKIKQQITEYGLVPEEWGGDTIMVEISAKARQNIDGLLEMVLLTAEMQELKANPNRSAKGSVIEARLDKTRGPIATLLVQNGTLNQGDIIIAGTAVGRVRVMTDAKGNVLKTAGPSVPVEITGLGEVPGAGDVFNAVEDERMARQLVEQRKADEKNALANAQTKVTLEDLFSHIQAGNMKELNIIVKADVQGSAEAVKASLLKITNDEVRVKVIHAGVGAINESDVLLASTASAIIVGFNVRPDAAAAVSAQRSNVDMRMYRVIYDAINEIQDAMKGMLAPQFKEVVTGHAEVRMTYKVSAIGTVAGCFVKDGKILRDAQVRVLRDNIVIHEGVLGSLQRFKDSVKEVTTNYECGMSIEKFNDIKEGDIFECFIMEQIKN